LNFAIAIVFPEQTANLPAPGSSESRNRENGSRGQLARFFLQSIANDKLRADKRKIVREGIRERLRNAKPLTGNIQ
jgi:hypothetical protein